MNIILCTDENYAMPCGVCITSIFENNKNEKCNIYILTNELKQSTISRFEQLSKIYGQKINIVKINTSLLNGLKVSDRFRESIYYRFIIPDIINDDKALYLDCDIIVTQNLTDLWNTDITDYACAVVEDQNGDDIRLHNRIEMYSTYFNSGMLLMNLDYWRKNKLKKHLVDYVYQNPERCLYPDQDALNALLENKVIFLDYKYNYQELMTWSKEKLFLHRSKWEQAHKYLNILPVIIHYTSSIKPWNVECNHCYKQYFIQYKGISPWATDKLKHTISLQSRCLNAIKNFVKKIIFIKNNENNP